MDEVKKLSKMLANAGKNVGTIIGIIENLRRDIKDTVKEIAALKMIPTIGDQIEKAISEKYRLKVDEIQKIRST